MRQRFTACVAASIVGLTSGAGQSFAAASTDTGVRPVGWSQAGQVDQARLLLARPLAATAAEALLAKATPTHPIEIVFRSGEWTGGVVTSGDSATSRAIWHRFVTRSKAATANRPVIAVGASRQTIDSTLAHYAGQRVTRPVVKAHRQITTSEVRPAALPAALPASLCQPNADCTETINGASDNPSFPQHGRLNQVRQQGIIESTGHTLYNFSNVGWPATLHTVALTNGQGGWIKPRYGYEHDYKVGNNGYVATTASYSWSTNLPGAYRDTRASDSSTILDFTIGSMFTWLLDSSKQYNIETDVGVKTASVLSDTAALTAQALPNDGAFNQVDAVAGGGCKFVYNPTTYNLTPTQGNGNYAWCTGIGNGAGSLKNEASYISLKPFTIKYTGTCRNWVLGYGATNC